MTNKHAKDTPGYEQEQIGKPKECDLISGTAGLFSSDSVASKILLSALKSSPSDSVYFGLEGWMLNTLTAGMSPVNSLFNACCQVFLMGLLRFVSLFYLADFRKIVRRCKKEREIQQKQEQVFQVAAANATAKLLSGKQE
uniref:Uncharacterized protein n=1 Tax=Proboscia inermis TaxID=420281 RepID=A0A7S0GC07_9STRA|mmetsp:Transcript_62621/g.73224  ORF Transcript_62621/g.73224 Transcript_62621/m.73224 type:complete len:140 (+) Transcript_62621:180-599(+)